MSDAKPSQVIFITGGTVQAGNGIYLPRPADSELLQLCHQSAFSYILTARQMGKSSLMTRTAESLTAEGIKSVIVDLTSLGINAPAEEWFLSLLTTIEDQTELDTDVVSWWQAHRHLTIAKRLENFFKEVLLAEVAEQIVIFIDEIDTTLNLNFSDDLFAIIRSLYNARAQAPQLQRLSFVLIGVATPSDLIRNPQVTPFNIGQRVELTDFTYEEALPLADGFSLPQARARQVLRWAHDWTNGHPYLTQRLCNEIAKEVASSGTDEVSRAEVDRIVADTFFGEKSQQDNNLLFVRDMLLKRAPDVSGVLTTYRHILDDIREVSDEEQSLIKSHLKLSGIVSQENGLLKMRNRIYATVFDQSWIKRHMPVNWKNRFYRLARMALIFSLLLPSAIAVYALQQRNEAERQRIISEEKNAELIEITKKQEETNRKLRESNEQLENAQAELNKALRDTEAANKTANKRRVEAEAQKAEAERQTGIAKNQRQEANEQAAEAKRQKELADQQKVLAQTFQAQAEELSKQADARRKGAEEQSKVTRSDELACRATSIAKIDPPLSYYLVDAALKSKSTDEAQQAFRNVVNELTNKIVLRDHPSNVLSAAFSPDGKYIATGGTESDGDASIRIWIAATGQLDKLLVGHTKSVQSVEYSNDGKFILSASNDGTAKIWDAETGRALRTLVHMNAAVVFSAAYNQDCSYIVTAGADGIVNLWDAVTGNKLNYFRDSLRSGRNEQNCKSAAFSPRSPTGEEFIVTGCDDSVVRVYGMKSRVPLKRIPGHTALVWSVAYSPNGDRIVSSGNDMTVRVWDAKSGKEILSLKGHTQRVKKAIFNRDGNRIVTSSQDNTTRIWDASTGQIVSELKGHLGEVFCANYSQDKRFIVTASADKTARVWDVSGQELSGHLKEVKGVAFSPDSRFIATASKDKEARIWDAVTGQIVMKVKRHEGAVFSASYSDDGQYIVTACQDGIARILDARTGQILHELKGHNGEVRAAIFMQDDHLIATAGSDQTVRIWDAQTKEAVRILRGHSDSVETVAYDPNNKLIATAGSDYSIRIWNGNDGKLVRENKEAHKGRVSTLAFSKDGKYLVSASDDSTAKIWEVVSFKLKKTLKDHKGEVVSSAFGHHLTQKNKYLIATASTDGTALVYQFPSNDKPQVFKGHTKTLQTVVFSPQDGSLLTASSDGSARIWDVASGNELRKFNHPEATANQTPVVYGIAYHPTGEFIVTTCNDGTALIWNVADNSQPLRDLSGHKGAIHSIAYSIDGERVVTASEDKTALVWGVKNGRLLTKFTEHKGAVHSAMFSPDGKFIVTASADKTARIWNASTGSVALPPLEHSDEVKSARYSHDGKFIATASNDSVARIWEVATGKEWHVFKGHRGPINTVTFSPDDKFILTASDDKTARIWAVEAGSFEELKGHDKRVLSAAFNQDGTSIITTSEDQTALIWDRGTLKIRAALPDSTLAVTDAAFSPDGKFVITASADNNVRIYREWWFMPFDKVRDFASQLKLPPLADLYYEKYHLPREPVIRTTVPPK